MIRDNASTPYRTLFTVSANLPSQTPFRGYYFEGLEICDLLWKYSDTDFDEKQVLWSCEKENEDSSPTQRMVKRVSNSTKGVSQQQSSAPVSIPDWSKIYGKHHANKDDDNNGMDDGMVYDGDDDDEMVPPHEWLAKKLTRSQISSFSVCEGVGRKLKGRDLSKVRNAVLTKTGFLE
ncbi:hypothetical protein PVK06_033112 [Gossypium arboreum]|uniref:Senescence regulator S40 n=1 Tax=Gossypium arboreum TaxID=29729 RepID=A0ABR0NB23_GOSAR|nr:hypothetical protein PVK06_033112 [Gossypium arboreum]